MAETNTRFSQLVVIGASAGGIEALSAFVGGLPKELPAPIIVAQHLSPHHLSSLTDILGRRSPLPVRTVVDREELEPGVIYVVPANRNVAVTDHEVELLQADAGPSAKPSVDLLFQSAADVFRENLIAIVLSGTGSDGATGARHVKEAGGTVIIQDPHAAPFPSMPLSLAPPLVDIVADAGRIGSVLHSLLMGVPVIEQQDDENLLRTFLNELYDESGIDFTYYKQPTIARRLQRRMVATSNLSLVDYVRYARSDPNERIRLVGSFLINVTEFFRDPEVFTYLQEHVIPELLEEAEQRGSELRLWSAGCSTGEEPYSLAIAVREAMASAESKVPVRIFGTDLDADAIAFARRGVYPSRALTLLSPELIERYFIQRDGDYEVRKELRALVVFGEHGLGQGAPFPRIDLLCCRNVLIYFAPALHRRALQLFAFSLRNGGYLVLGRSESIRAYSEYFMTDQASHKVFRRLAKQAAIPTGLGDILTPAQATRHAGNRDWSAAASRRRAVRPRDTQPGNPTTQAEVALLGLPIGFILIDEQYAIRSINGAARRFFGIHNAAIDRDFLHTIRYYDTLLLKRAIDTVFAGESRASVLLTSSSGPTIERRSIRVTCYPASPGKRDDPSLVTLIVEDVTELEQLRESAELAQMAAQRLRDSNEEILSANFDLTTTIATLRAENEELLVAAEQIQAATEEVETLNEELQASNEELETLNEELQASTEELNTTNEDLHARTLEIQELARQSEQGRNLLVTVLNQLSEAIFVIDSKGNVIHSNRAYAELFVADPGEIVSDEGEDALPPQEWVQQRAKADESFVTAFTLRSQGTPNRRFVAEGRQHTIGTTNEAVMVITVKEMTDSLVES
jgi:two-component system, chemotaxis family, CheB/CheR fusion protein